MLGLSIAPGEFTSETKRPTIYDDTMRNKLKDQNSPNQFSPRGSNSNQIKESLTHYSQMRQYPLAKNPKEKIVHKSPHVVRSFQPGQPNLKQTKTNFFKTNNININHKTQKNSKNNERKTKKNHIRSNLK